MGYLLTVPIRANSLNFTFLIIRWEDSHFMLIRGVCEDLIAQVKIGVLEIQFSSWLTHLVVFFLKILWCGPFFKVFIEFVTVLFLYYILCFMFVPDPKKPNFAFTTLILHFSSTQLLLDSKALRTMGIMAQCVLMSVYLDDISMRI